MRIDLHYLWRLRDLLMSDRFLARLNKYEDTANSVFDFMIDVFENAPLEYKLQFNVQVLTPIRIEKKAFWAKSPFISDKKRDAFRKAQITILEIDV